MYDRAHGTLEGLTAPYGSVGDVAPQGIADLGRPPDTGPVGSAIGDAAEAIRGDDPTVEDTHTWLREIPSAQPWSPRWTIQRMCMVIPRADHRLKIQTTVAEIKMGETALKN